MLRYGLSPSEFSSGTVLQPIQKVIMPGSVLTGETERGNPPDAKNGPIVSNVSDKEWTDLLNSAGEPCTRRLFVARSDPEFLTWSNFLGNSLRTFIVEAELHYYSPHKRSMQLTTFDAVGVLSHDPGCAQKN